MKLDKNLQIIALFCTITVQFDIIIIKQII